MSVISSTDVDIFRRLGNPEVVDVSAAGAGTTRQIASQMRRAIESAVAARRDVEGEDEEDDAETTPEASPEPAPTRREHQQEVGATDGTATRKSTALGEASSRASPERGPSRLSQAMASVGALRLAPTYPASDDLAPGVTTTARPVMVEAGDNSDEEEDAPPRPRAPPASEARAATSAESSSDPEQIRLEKQGYLIELQGLERRGVALSRSFSMRDSVAELEFELQKQQSCLSTANAVSFMRDSLKMAFNGVEIANNRLGPFLSIDGWADSITADMKRFDNALERLYKRYWRKSQMSPLMELAWIIVGSLVAHHFKQKFFGPVRSVFPVSTTTAPPAAAAAPPAARRPPPAARATFPDRLSAASARERPTSRPTLRPPLSVF